ncbi:phosphoadenylyl-sulfate reductase [Jatrophihabitans lederbergiae]|uniref:Adenosine 5'-phosphosulfate reductase n=1 Tax=Jatrophihabitans lederbergiae TaxID=3075547 RepID=A0ABU2J8M5_9ACTN|nr:phosphoadenylyl-sulfate reductase [Jatrophihabitans sp. DSM 44399]MDT0261331.1 phosphoadenylyl-sulfate reductase [Jatrophihabitans sp. DSM 44399]
MSLGTDLTSLQALAERAGDELEDASALEILEWARQQFGTEWCVTSSMADAVLPHLASRAMPGVDVVFLDTGYHFAETIGMRDAVSAVLPVNVRTMLPLRTVAQQDAEFGPKLHDRDPGACCAMRKVEPLERALAPYRAWASGVRRADSPTRAGARVVEWDAKRNMVKLNPIATWTDEQVDAYIAENGILVNPLLSDGYGSIGCGPCTRRLLPGEDARAGRWAGLDKTECGLHT